MEVRQSVIGLSSAIRPGRARDARESGEFRTQTGFLRRPTSQKVGEKEPEVALTQSEPDSHPFHSRVQGVIFVIPPNLSAQQPPSRPWTAFLMDTLVHKSAGNSAPPT